MIRDLRHQKSLKKVKKCKKVKVRAFFFVGGQTGEDCLPYLSDGLKSRVRHWLNRFLRLSLGISPALSLFRKMVSYEILGSKEKKRREEELGRFGCVGIASRSQGALPNFQRLVSDDRKTQTIRTGNSGRHTKEGDLSTELSFFRRKQSRMLGKKKVKVTENRIENTDFAYAATSRPGHMPRQLPARLSGIRSIKF